MCIHVDKEKGKRMVIKILIMITSKWKYLKIQMNFDFYFLSQFYIYRVYNTMKIGARVVQKAEKSLCNNFSERKKLLNF